MKKTPFFYILIILMLAAINTSAVFATAERAVVLNDTEYHSQWYMEKIGAPEAWNFPAVNHDVVVAVLDTGVDLNNPDLRNNIWINDREIIANDRDDDKNGYADDINGWDFVNNVPDPRPKFQTGFIDSEINHGTIVAGIIAAAQNNNFGIAGIAGQAKIMPLKVLNDKGEGTIANVVKAIDYAVNNKADIINLSFVVLNDIPELKEAIKRAYDAKIIVVAPAGNESRRNAPQSLDQEPLYPVCYQQGNDDYVVGVAATDALDQKTPFSNYGFSCVDISAPGVSFMGLTFFNPYQTYEGRPFDSYYEGYWDGTSMATAVVSGGFALIKSINPRLSREEAIAIIFNTAKNISRLNPNYLGQLGSGRIDLGAAAQAAYNNLRSRQDYVLAAIQSGGDNIQLFNVESEASSTVAFKFYPEGLSNSGANIAAGDLDGDGQSEIITAADGQIKVFDAQGKMKNKFFVRGLGARLSVAAGDLDGDGKEDIVVGAGRGYDPKVIVYNHEAKIIRQFFAYDKKFRGGVNVAAGDIDGNGKDEIIAGAGVGQALPVDAIINIGEMSTNSPHVRIFNEAGKAINEFMVYSADFNGGVNVGALAINLKK